MLSLEQLHPLALVCLVPEYLSIRLLNVLFDTGYVDIRWQGTEWRVVVNGGLSIMHVKDLIVRLPPL